MAVDLLAACKTCGLFAFLLLERSFDSSRRPSQGLARSDPSPGVDCDCESVLAFYTQAM